MTKPGKRSVESILELATTCDSMVEELGGVSYVAHDGEEIEARSYFAGVADALEWMTGNKPAPVDDDIASELRSHVGGDEPDDD